MALISTHTATKCGPSGGASYEVPVGQTWAVPPKNLGAVRVSTSPDIYHCCVIDRSQVNQTDENDVKPVQDSGYTIDECQACQTHWS